MTTIEEMKSMEILTKEASSIPYYSELGVHALFVEEGALQFENKMAYCTIQ